MTKRHPRAQTFTPRWPDITSLPLDQVRLTFDRATDTLFVDSYGEARPAASIPVDRGDRDYIYLRIDPETDAVVGLQIEHFFTYAIEQHRELAAALDAIPLVGIGRDDLNWITRCCFGDPREGNLAVLMAVLAPLSE